MSSIEKEIIAEKKKLSTLMREKYTVDPFQREYKWERKHVEQLLVDLEASFLTNYEADHTLADVSEYNGYYLGPVVICKLGRNRAIIDGQQRLTSITLLLIYLNNLQKDAEEPEEVAPLIFSRKGGANTYNIEISQRQAILDALFRNGQYDLGNEEDLSVRNMYDRYLDIANFFPESLQGEVLPLFIEWLKENVVFVEILAHSNENAYTIFETMNDRGLNLTPAEMLKGYLLSNINDADKVDEINSLWKKQVSKLHSYSLQEEQEFIKAWLRSVYAETIRSSVKGAENEDFEKIGTRFHTWVKDNHKKIGLRDTESFYFFVKGDFDFYANIYQKILHAERNFTPGMEIIFLSSEWCIANSLAYPLLMASVSKLDDEDTIILKLNAVYRFLDIFTVARSINNRSNTQTALRYTIYSLVKDIRNKPINELKSILRSKLPGSSERVDNLQFFSYQYDNRRFVHYFLARMIYYLETDVNNHKISFLDLLPSRRRNRLVLTPIIDNDMDQYGHNFENEDDLYQAYNLIGNHLLIPNTILNDFDENKTIQKLKMLYGTNSYNETLIASSPFSNQVGLMPIQELNLHNIRSRTAQIAQLAKEIWNPDLI